MFAPSIDDYHDYYAELTQRNLSGPPLKDGLLYRAYVTHFPAMYTGACATCSSTYRSIPEYNEWLERGLLEALDWLEQHSI